MAFRHFVVFRGTDCVRTVTKERPYTDTTSHFFVNNGEKRIGQCKVMDCSKINK